VPEVGACLYLRPCVPPTLNTTAVGQSGTARISSHTRTILQAVNVACCFPLLLCRLLVCVFPAAFCRESVAINSSLMTLARCLEVLRYNQQHPGDQKVIPYRESKVGALALLKLAGMRSGSCVFAVWCEPKFLFFLPRGTCMPACLAPLPPPLCAARSLTCSRTCCTATAAL
jgi:hypothetical protein